MSKYNNSFGTASGFNIGDHYNGGTHISNQHSGSGTQNNNNATGTQNINYGRDQNSNSGSGSMSVNNREPWQPRPYAPQPSWGYGGYNNKQGNEWRDGAYGSPPRDTPSPRPQPPKAQNAGRPTGASQSYGAHGARLSPEELAKKEQSFRGLVTKPREYRRIVETKGGDAQRVLDNWQLLSDCTKDATLRLDLLRAMIKLSKNSGLSPQCLEIRVSDLSKRPVERGGFADIWTGKMNDVKVAVKVVRDRGDAQENEQMIKAFTREAMGWRLVNHPNILPFMGTYWFKKEQEEICLVSPWMENGNLLQFLNSRHVDVDQTTQLELAKDVSQGLAYLHELNIVHGGLKSHNILISSDHTALIADFGLSRVVSSEESGRAIRWLAPELLESQSGERSEASRESDVYSFGCVCYEIYSKQIPFKGFSDFRIYAMVKEQNKRPEIPSQTPVGMQQLMEKCWDADPGSRPDVTTIVEEISQIHPEDLDSATESDYLSAM